MRRLALVATTLLTWATVAVADGFVCAGPVDLAPAPAADVAAAETLVAAARPALTSGAAKAARVSQSSTTGTRQALVLFARFSGQAAAPVPEWGSRLFDPSQPGSFAHFYDTMSFGKLRVRGEVGLRVYTSSHPVAAYLADDSTRVGQFGRFSLEILTQADADLDFARFDNDGPDGVPDSGDDDAVVDAVFIVLAAAPTNFLVGAATGVPGLGFGGQAAVDPAIQGRELITGDRSASGQPIRISADQGTIQQGRSLAEAVGAMCHEYGHVLGLPDLYNVDFLRQPGAPPEADGAGVGAWCLMGWGALGWEPGDGPTSLCAWSRARLGWAQLRTPTQAQAEMVLEEVGAHGQVYQLPLSGRESFLLEYRRRSSTWYDRHLPAEGVLIWHVERTLAEGDQPPRTRVDLECADGRWQEAGYPLGQTAAPQEGGTNLDFWAHDSTYAQAHAGNLGDETDPFDGVRFTAFTPQTNPAAVSHDGTLSARIEGIHREGAAMVARVQTAPLVVEVRNLRIKDEDADGFALAGERLQLSFTLANTGGVIAQQLKALLRSEDPWVEILQGDSHLQDLEPGRSSFRPPADGYPALRLRDGFVGVHQATLTLEIYAGETLVGQAELVVNGLSPRQQVGRVAVIDSLGNGDGRVQGGEFIRLQVELEQVEEPAPLRYFTFAMGALDSQIRSLGSTQVVFAGTATRTGSSGEFLVPVGVAPGNQLQFELAVHSPFNTWRDTIAVEVAAGPDQTPPRVLGLQTRPVAGGVRLVLLADQVLEGGQVRRAEAVIYTLKDTSEVARAPLPWQDHHYEGVWTTAQADIYLAAALVEDEAGNQGWSRLHGFGVQSADTRGGPGAASAWEQIALPEQRRPVVNRLLRAPGNPEVLYAMGSQGIWRSVDGGGSWERLGVMRSGEDLGVVSSLELLSIRWSWADAGDPFLLYGIPWSWNFYLADAVDPFLLYTIPWYGHLARSRDGGMSWQTLKEAVYLLAADPERSGRLYGAAEDGGLVISEDRGDTWSPTPVDTAYFVLVNPAYPQYLCSGEPYPGGSLWRSADGGRTWAKSRWTHRRFWDLVADPRSPLGLYATSQDTLWHSEDGGDTWQPLWTQRRAYQSPRLTVHPADPPQLLVRIAGAIWRSRDAGQTWEEVVVPHSVRSLVLDPRDPDQYYAVVSSTRSPVSLLHSADAGGHWEEVALPETGPPIGTVVFDRGGRIYAGASRFQTPRTLGGGNVLPGFCFSPGDGQEWRWQGEKLDGGSTRYSDPPPIDLLYVDAQQPQILIAALGVSYLRSTDGGRIWRHAGVSVAGFYASYPTIVTDPRQAGIYYLPDQRGVWRSADYGETWENRSAGLSSYEWGSIREVTGLALDTRAEAAVLHASIAGSDRLWRSTDEGLHWEYAGRLGEGESIAVLAINPLAADRLYALTDHGAVYVSADQWQGWTLLLPGDSEWARGWSFDRKKRLRFDPGDPNRFFVVRGPQLLETRDGGLHWRSLGDDLASVPWFNDVAVDPLAPHLVYAATPWGLFRLNTSEGLTAVEQADPVPQHFALYPNYPNPFNPSTAIRFSLPQARETELAIYDLLGQRVAVLVRGGQEAGGHTVVWSGRDEQGRELASGVYLYRLQAGTQVEIRKLLLLR